jgi:glycolate oxidase
MALATTIGHTQKEADRQAMEMVRIFQAQGAIKAFQVISAKEQEDYWASRDNILNILQATESKARPTRLGSLEAAVPLSRLAESIAYLQSGHGHDILYGAKPFIYGHVGTCDLHAMWVISEEWPLEKRKQAAAEITALEGEINLKWGCASGEIGQTAARIAFLRQRYGEDAFSLLLKVKNALDPNGILNPGNLED